MSKEDSHWTLGHKLKNLRTSKGYTLQVVADALGVTAQFISMLEKGRSGISFANIQKLMSFYDLTLADLVEEKCDSDRVIRLEQSEILGYDIEGVEARSLIKNIDKSKPSTTYFRLQQNASIDYMEHNGDEIMFVIEGTLEIILVEPKTKKQEKHILSTGDTIFHPSIFKHKCTNVSNKTASFLVTYYDYISE